jgi:signal transduction histidine kinase
MEALGRMASAIAHDFNNVLGAMSMTAELATAEPADLPALIARMNQIIATGQRLSDQLLAFAKERPDGATGSCDLRAVIEGLLPMLRTATGARATLVFEPSAAARVPIDVSQAEQVLLNLVLNARDAIAERGTIRIVVRDATPEDEGPPRAIVLAVIDDGAGMDEATRSRVLEPYFTTKAYGSGLGLSIVFGIVRRAGGSVRVASAPGAGTTVTLVVPRHQPAQ